MTVRRGEADPRRGAAATAVTKALRPPNADRFAGGREYTLHSIRPRSTAPRPRPSRLGRLRAVPGDARIASPTSRFEIVEAPTPGPPAEGAVQDPGPADRPGARGGPGPAQGPGPSSLQNDPNFLFERIENFGGTVAGETRILALVATVASWLIIIAYLWFRFKSLVYGLAAVLALVHDVLVTLGAVAVSYWLDTIPGVREFLLLDQFKIDLPMIAAFLTLIGFSVNDTIVIFDRIREIKGKTPYLTPR